jgi:uncharacterized protein
MEQRGHDFFISAKEKDVTIPLLEHYQIKHINRGKAASSPLGKALNILQADLKLYRHVKKFSPDLVISFSSPIAAHLAFLLHKPCIAIEDTECAGWVQKSYLPFSSVVLTPSCFNKDLGKKQIIFNAYKELAYLHPQYFNTEIDGHKKLNLNPQDNYTIIRYVGHSALHDVGYQHISDSLKIFLVEKLSQYSKIFISSETKLPLVLEPYRLNISPWEMHSVMAGASLLIGESATMAAESAILGVPAIFIDSQGRGYTKELEEKYQLLFNFRPDTEGVNQAICKAIELLELKHNSQFFTQHQQQMLSEKIDITAYLLKFTENFLINNIA